MKKENQSILELKKHIKKGDTVYTILRHVSASGMTRVIDCKLITKKGEVLHLGHLIAGALKYSYIREKNGLKVHGCGMDMGFQIVYELSRLLFKDGYAISHRWL